MSGAAQLTQDVLRVGSAAGLLELDLTHVLADRGGRRESAHDAGLRAGIAVCGFPPGMLEGIALRQEGARLLLGASGGARRDFGLPVECASGPGLVDEEEEAREACRERRSIPRLDDPAEDRINARLAAFTLRDARHHRGADSGR